MSWYVVRTATRREKDALSGLKELGLTAWCPMERRKVKHARQSSHKEYPLLQGYIFAQITADEVWLALTADRVHDILGGPTDANRRGQPISERAMAWFIAAEHLGAFNRDPWIPPPVFAVGKEVKVTGGKLKGLLGKIVEARGAKRFLVAIEAFRTVKDYEIEKAHLAPADLRHTNACVEAVL